MNHQHLHGTGLPLMFNSATTANMNSETGVAGFVDPVHFEAQQQYHVSQADATMYDYIRSDYIGQNHAHWGHSQAPHPSAHSSTSSSARSSNNSNYSQWQTRSSMASTSSSCSSSDQTREDYITKTERALGYTSQIPLSYNSGRAGAPTSPLPLPKKRNAQRQSTEERDPFATCVSRPQRPRRSQKEGKYACTACKEPFATKYDWKRHEETYQERPEMFQCSLCNVIYFLDKDFLLHHQKGHRCKTCDQFRHVMLARKHRMTRTGWGCGFCVHFSTDWKERCHHVARHFEKDGMTMGDWHQSTVIYSLLQRPEVAVEWEGILYRQQRMNPRFGWNQHTTGRVEGYPESNPRPQLQDLLEYFKPTQNAAALAQLAYEQGLLRKKLPSTPAPSHVSKDHRHHNNTSTQSPANYDVPWNQITNTIPEDDIMPSGVCNLDFDFLDNPYGMA